MDFLAAINTASIAFIAVLGAFIVFRLQWLRRELDDYRGRITFLLNGCDPAQTSDEDETRCSKILNSGFKETADQLNQKNDDEYASYVEKILALDLGLSSEQSPKIAGLEGEFGGLHTTLGTSYRLFRQRLLKKQQVLKYFRSTAIFLLAIFILTLGGLAKLGPVLSGAQRWFLDILLPLIFVPGTVIIFMRLYHHLKEDY